MLKARKSSHWAAIEDTGVVWGMRLMLWTYNHFGRTAFRLFLYPVVAYYFLTNRLARAASLDYLKRLQAYQPECAVSATLWDSYRHFISFAEGILDKIIAWLGKFDLDTVHFPEREEFLRLLQNNQGALVAGAHLGNLEVCRALAEFRKNVRLNILVHTKHTEKFNRLLSSVDDTTQMELIQVTELNPAVAITLYDKINQGEFVILVGDRIPIASQGRTVAAQFLGHEAPFPQGPYILAALLRCPIYTLFCFRHNDGRYHIHFESLCERIILARKGPARHQQLAQHAQLFADRLEQYCLRAPLQWFNFYRFWEAPEDNPTWPTDPTKGELSNG